MNYYFMPRIKGIDSAVTLVNFSCVETGKKSVTQYAHVTWSDGKKWQVRYLDNIEPDSIQRFTNNDLPDECDDTCSPFLFLYPEKLSDNSDMLVVSDHMETVPTWRGNIQFFSKSAAVSFQGEFPGGMTKIPKGSLVSSSNMIQLSDKASTKLILPNMRLNPAIEEGRLILVKARSGEVLKEEKIYTNTINVISTDGITFDPPDMLLVMTPDMVCIPMYFSHNSDFTQLSLEHTHPPSSLLVFGDVNKYQRQIKSHWLGKFFKQ
jgi:hypothetical protein